MAYFFGGAPGRFVTQTVTLSGTTASTAAEVANGRLIGVITPSTWTTSALTFEVSIDGTTWVTLVNTGGTVTTPALAASQACALELEDFVAWPHVRILSTTSQPASRTVTLVIAPVL